MKEILLKYPEKKFKNITKESAKQIILNDLFNALSDEILNHIEIKIDKCTPINAEKEPMVFVSARMKELK